MAEQLAVLAVACAAVFAFTNAYHSPTAWLLLAPAALSPFWRFRAVPPRLRTTLPLLARAVILVTVVFGIAWSIYPVLPPVLVARGPRIVGHVLVALLTTLVLGSAVWPPAGAAIPVALALLVDAAFEKRSEPAYLPVALTAAALVAYALASNRTVRPVDTRGRRPRRAARKVAVLALAVGSTAAIARVLPWAQPYVESSVAKAMSPYVQYAGFSDNTSLGSIEELALSPKVVMRVWTDRPQKLRARVYTRFDGLGWHARPNEPAAPLQAAGASGAVGSWLAAIPGRDFLVPGEPPETASDAQAIRTRIVQSDVEGALLAPAAILLVRLAHPSPFIDRFGVLRPLYPIPRVYGVVNRPTASSSPLADDLRAETLALPTGGDRRLRALADRLSAEGRDEADRAQRTLGYLYANCRYSLKVGRFRTKEPVAEFLFEKKRGYCEYFASAAAVLLRLQGIPARYVAGFNVTDGTFRGGHYLVRESDAHAWIEVFLPGVGWTEADPTPAAQYMEVHPPLGRDVLADALEWARAKWAEVSARIGAGDLAALARWAGRELWAFLREQRLVLAAVTLAAALWTARRRLAPRAGRRARRPPAEPDGVPRDLALLLAQVDQRLARAGCARPESRAPQEHLQSLPADRLPADLRAAAEQVVDCFYRARFGGAEVPPELLRQLETDLRELI
jgi:transglutaminase-like putative cysteine protease